LGKGKNYLASSQPY